MAERRLATLARKVPVDVAAFVAIAVVIFVTHRPLMRLGMCFNDASWYFHFGRRLLEGDAPYRDYLFQVGPLPIYVDAAFQSVFGSKYMASLYAALLIKIVRVYAAWAIARRVANPWAAIGVAFFCAFDPAFAFVYHWSTPYAELFVSLSGLLILSASNTDGRAALVRLAAAGFFAGLIVSARQSTAIMLGVVGLATTGLMLYRKEYFTRQRFLALWGGFGVGFVVIFIVLAFEGALGPAIQQMFLDAPAKKGFSGLDAILDALSGGALIHSRFDPNVTWWAAFLYFIGFPILITAGVCYLASRTEPVTPQALAVLAMPIVLIGSLLHRFGEIGPFGDLPRTLFTAITALAVLWPRRLKAWLGVEPIIAVALGTLPLASDWAMELSNLGRGWGDPPALVLGMIMLPLASSHLGRRMKIAIGAGLAFAAMIHLESTLRQGANPIGNDGLLAQTTYPIKDPIMREIRVSEPRKMIFDWLRKHVPPGSTCFIYGNLPVLYTLLDCRNPTNIDTTAADFMTAADADRAVAILQANPPDYLIAHELAFMNPSLRIDLQEKLEWYQGMNPKTSFSLHVGVRRILDQYEDIGFAADFLGPERTKIIHDRWDIFDQVRLYRRKRQ